MGFEADWKVAKKTFETATGKKKPSEKVLGLFRKSSGMETSLKAVDVAVKAKKKEDAKTARNKYELAYGKYLTPLYAELTKALTTHDKTAETALKALESAAGKILEEIDDSISGL